jgi:sulfatase maturation enzyme AslB (radical SAM superfamily)
MQNNRTEESWLKTSQDEARGFIDPEPLKEVWFHTGTACNLQCPDCYEHASPGDHRLEMVSFEEVKPFIDEAIELGVEQLSFTGGEPFVNRDLLKILDYALDRAPCLVLSNGTLQSRFHELFPLVGKKHPLSFRISLDYPDAAQHDFLRGSGMFAAALESLSELYSAGFRVSVARRREEDEGSARTDSAYRPFFDSVDLPPETPIISFPTLGKTADPEITEDCMRTHHTPETCAQFMCAFSRMVLKKEGELRVYACTLVDDHPHYDLGSSLTEAARERVMLCHPRCFACFSGDTSCSEL